MAARERCGGVYVALKHLNAPLSSLLLTAPVSHAEATRLLALTASGSGIRAASGAQPNRPVWYRDADIAAAGQSAAAAAALGGTEMAGVEATGTDALASGDAAGGASSDAKRKRTAGTYGGAAM